MKLSSQILTLLCIISVKAHYIFNDYHSYYWYFPCVPYILKVLFQLNQWYLFKLSHSSFIHIEIGIGLILIGLAMFILGVVMLLDRGFLAIGNVIFSLY